MLIIFYMDNKQDCCMNCRIISFDADSFRARASTIMKYIKKFIPPYAFKYGLHIQF